MKFQQNRLVLGKLKVNRNSLYTVRNTRLEPPAPGQQSGWYTVEPTGQAQNCYVTRVYSWHSFNLYFNLGRKTILDQDILAILNYNFAFGGECPKPMRNEFKE